MMVASLFARSQTYPLISENNIVKVESLGWSYPNYVIKVTNKGNCNTTFRINYLTGTKDTTLSANAVAVIKLSNVSPTATYIRVKRTSGGSCVSNCSESYVYVGITNTALAIKFKSFSAQRISADSVKIVFESEEDNTIEYYVARISLDGGKTWKEVAIVMPDGIIGSKTYSVTIKIKP